MDTMRLNVSGSLFRLSLGVLLACGAYAADGGVATPVAASSTASIPADGADSAQVMYLGDIKVTGQKVIVAVLQQIKVALDRPFDTSRQHENDIVCRISSSTGFREHQYLICATNKQFTHLRYMVRQSLFDANSRMGQKTNNTASDDVTLLQNLTVQNPDHVLRMPLDASKFEALLHKIPATTSSTQAGDPASGQ